MDLIYLHGPPASGKLTIAKELAARTGCGVFHNHLAIDMARPFFEFGSEQFWELVGKLRLTALRYGSASTKTVVYTSCYDHPADLAQFELIESIVQHVGGRVRAVYLQCSLAELERRVTHPSRAQMEKVRSVAGLHGLLRRWNCVAVPRKNCVTIVTDEKTPSACASEIVALLDMQER